MAAHEQAILHRAFSVFVFNTAGDVLMQQRAHSKYHSGGLWTNTCCSHPRPGEEVVAAASRRLQEEMGFTTNLTKAFDFTYKAVFENGLTEHEFDHVF
jgi:isopentenyl-diphosphate delta-isomerase